MKLKHTKILVQLAVVFTCFCAFTAEKYFTLRFTEADLNNHFKKLSAIRQLVNNSNLPHQEVVFVLSSIDGLQNDVVQQVKAQSEPAPAPKK